MNLLLNVILFIGSLQATGAEKPWFERILGGISNFLIFHLAITLVFDGGVRDNDIQDFILKMFSYVKIFDDSSQIFPFLIPVGAVYLIVISVRYLNR